MYLFSNIESQSVKLNDELNGIKKNYPFFSKYIHISYPFQLRKIFLSSNILSSCDIRDYIN